MEANAPCGISEHGGNELQRADVLLLGKIILLQSKVETVTYESRWPG
jgi:hypothetical protein